MLEVIFETVSEFDTIEIQDEITTILNDKIVNKMNDKERQFFMDIYPVLKETGQIQNGKASEFSGKPSGTVRRYLIKMAELGIFTVTGKNKNRTYILNDKVIDK